MAISIPIFKTQLNKAKYAADEANARSIYAELQADYLANGGTQKITLSATSVTAGTATASPVVTVAACSKAGVADAVTFGGTVTAP